VEESVNVAEVERWASALGGAALAALGIRQVRESSIGGAIIAAAGTTLIYRGATGHCPVYAAAGVSTSSDRSDTRTALAGSHGVHVEEAVTIGRPAAELYGFWRRFDRLPSFMEHLVSVRCLDDRRSHWTAKAPAGRTVEWDAEIIRDIPNEMISWRTVGDPDVISAGSVHFSAQPGNRGTIVRTRLQYEPPAGKLGAIVARMFGQEPSQQIREDLRHFKQLMEAGEIATTSGQPHGRRR